MPRSFSVSVMRVVDALLPRDRVRLVRPQDVVDVEEACGATTRRADAAAPTWDRARAAPRGLSTRGRTDRTADDPRGFGRAAKRLRPGVFASSLCQILSRVRQGYTCAVRRSRPNNHVAVAASPRHVCTDHLHRRRRDSFPRISHVAVAASPRLVTTECPRRGRGVAVTCYHGMSTSRPRRRRDSSTDDPRRGRGVAPACSR